MEVEPMETTTSERTIEILRTLFACYGLSKCLRKLHMQMQTLCLERVCGISGC